MILMRPGIDLTLTHGSVPISGPDKECVCILYNPLGTKSPYKDPLNHAGRWNSYVTLEPRNFDMYYTLNLDDWA